MNFLQTQKIETKRPAFRWLGFNGKRDNGETFSSKSPNVEQSQKREFGSDMTNLDFGKRSRLISAIDEKWIKVQMKPSAHLQCNQMQQQHQPNSKGYDFGPFRPVLQDREKKAMKNSQNCETMFSSHHLQYRNQGNSLYNH